MQVETSCVAVTKTQQEADVVECNPASSFDHVVACGTYHLDEKSKERVGGISLYELDQEKESFSLCSFVERAGVLDCRWNPSGDHLITAEADGKIGLFSMAEETKTIQVKAEYELPSKSITLAVDWNVLEEGKCIGSYSDGTIVSLEGRGSEMKEDQSFIAHEGAEVWALACSKFSPDLFFSGGDDCKLKYWDRRQPLASSCPIVAKRYDMGVTSIQSSMWNENYIVVGSYDESVSIWDLRNMRRALTDIRVGGGVWRVKWNPNDSRVIMAACMYNEFQLVEVQEGCEKLSLLGDLFGSPHHEAGKLAYGADWFRPVKCKGEKTEHLAAVCSFYDSKASCWSFTF